jgi:hypothetical protein
MGLTEIGCCDEEEKELAWEGILSKSPRKNLLHREETTGTGMGVGGESGALKYYWAASECSEAIPKS